MKKIVLSLCICSLIIFSTLGCSSIDHFALKRPIMPQSTLGIIVHPRTMDTEYAILIQFMKAGYRVKALNTISNADLFPGARNISAGLGKISFEKFYEMAMMRDVRLEIALRNDLELLKKSLGLDYLIFLENGVGMYYAAAIDLATYDVIYIHRYSGDMTSLDTINTFILTMSGGPKTTGSTSDTKPEK